MAFNYYYISTHPVRHTKVFYTLDQAQKAHKDLWVWKSENPHLSLEQWPDFQANGGPWPIGFMYSFVCDLTKDQLGVRRCADCPAKWVDKYTHKAMGRWSPWHWCDYPGALVSRYHRKLEENDFEGAKEVALEISELKLSSEMAAQVVKTQELPTYTQLVEQINHIEQATAVTQFGREALDKTR